MNQVREKSPVCVGALAGFALLLFAGALVATSQLPGFETEATIGLRGRKLTTNTEGIDNGGVLTDGTAAATIAPPVNIRTTLEFPPPVGAVTIQVASTTGFVVGMWIIIDPDAADPAQREERHIKALVGTNVIEFYKPLLYSHTAGTPVFYKEESLHQQSLHQSGSDGRGSSGSMKSSDSSTASFARSSESSRSSESGSMEGNLARFEAGVHGIGFGSSGLLHLLLGICYACVYKSKVVDPMGVMRHQPLQHEMHNDFRYGLCDCAKDVNICLMVLCCPLVRIAHTNEAADVCGFWESFAIMALSFCCPCGPLCMNVYFRIHIKDHMGIQDHCFNDFCLTLFCFACVTGQQAMAVDEVLGWKFKCPCNIEHVSHSGGYGQAMNFS